MLRLIRFCFTVVVVLAWSGVAAADCGPFVSVPPEHAMLGPNHHPVGKPMPDNASFNQPDTCGEGVWYYDANHNEQADPGEPRLFGSDKTIACGSCHAESPDSQTAASMSVFLRQDASRLCLVCHNQ